ncbi:MAG: MASE3 domain-containing protein [Parcubacteria group bacterium]|jgi:hypothetical protein
MDETNKKVIGSVFPVLLVVSSLVLHFTSLYSYLLFHTVVELFTVIIAFGIFALAWATRQITSNNFLLILGVGLFFAGSLDLMHLLAYKGMNVFSGIDANIPTQLWLAARFLEAVIFVLALLALNQKIIYDRKSKSRAIYAVFTACLAYFILAVLSIFYWDNFPHAYDESAGLTTFKIYGEYLIAVLFLVSVGLIFLKKEKMDSEVANLLSLSLIVKIGSEIMFTEYAGVFDFSNMLGHLLKYISFLILYKAVMEAGLLKPYAVLFKDLKDSEEKAKSLARFPEENPNPVMRVDFLGHLQYGNASAREFLNSLGWRDGMAVPQTIFSAVDKIFEKDRRGELELSTPQGQIYSFVISPNGSDKTANLYGADVTERRKIEKNLLAIQNERRRKAEEKLIESYSHLGIVNRRITLLLDIEKKAQNERSKQDIVDYILHSVLNLSGGKAAMLFKSVDEDSFELLGERGLAEKYKADFQKIAIANIAFARKLKDEVVRISGPCQQFSPCCFKINLGFSYFVVLPLARDEKLKGFIFLGFNDRVSMEPGEQEFLDVFTTYVTVALFRAKILK